MTIHSIRGTARLVALAIGLVGAGPRIASACVDPFVQELLADGDAFRAVSLLKQREHGLRGSPDGFSCARLLLRLFIQHQEFEAADAHLGRMLISYSETKQFGSPARLRAELALRFGNPSEVRSRLADDPGVSTDDLLVHGARVLEGQRSAGEGCQGAGCEQLRDLVGRDRQLGRKSGLLASVLGLVPGAGQIYAGRVWAGVGSLLLNGALVSLAGYAWHRDERGLAIGTTVVAAATYTGNIYAGYEAARRENVRRDRDLREAMLRLPLGLGIDRLAAGPMPQH